MSTRDERIALWKYYATIAECLGRKIDKKNNTVTQSSFSLYWFFYKMMQGKLDGESGLLGAYLGNETALKELEWNKELPTDWNNYFVGKNPMNDSQLASVEMALKNPITFIQGPPGTGKTATILNIMSSIVRMGKTVAVVSGNGSAVTNVVDKIKEFKTDDKDSNGYKLYQSFAPLGNKGKREDYNKSKENLENKRYTFENKTEIFKEDELTFKWSHERTIKAEEFLKDYPAVTSTIHSVLSLFEDSLDYKFDYVIMDESSQTSVINGLLAMYCAKRLILVGDLEQLPPVVLEDKIAEISEEKEVQILKGMQFFDEVYDLKADRSFLESCQKYFSAVCGEKQLEIMLNEHFRCHPGIFGFCKQYIYDPLGKGELSIKTLKYDESVRCPIRVLWFEGDYAEPCFIGKIQTKPPVNKEDKEELMSQVCYGEKGRPLTSKRNMHQVEVFMQEEWPRIEKYMRETDDASICILTPYKGMLYELRERFYETCNEDWILDSVISKNIEEGKNKLQKKDFYIEITGEDKEDEIASLTIHKSQGQEFDRVYLLPVDDGDWEWPWSQNKRLINVAISRAKKELCVIVSSCLMEKQLQEKLTGHYVVPSENEKLSDEEVEKRNPQERFLQKLMRYVWEMDQKERGYSQQDPIIEREDEYGFHKSKISSVLADSARICVWRNEMDKSMHPSQRNKKKGKHKISSHEICAISHIMQMDVYKERNLSIYYNVEVSDLLQENREFAKKEVWENIRNYQARLNGGMHFDLVICRDDYIQCVIEIDGDFHRMPGYSKRAVESLVARLEADRIKDGIAESIFQIPLLRWRSDGAGKNELEELETILKETTRKTVQCHPNVHEQVIWQEELKLWNKVR